MILSACFSVIGADLRGLVRGIVFTGSRIQNVFGKRRQSGRRSQNDHAGGQKKGLLCAWSAPQLLQRLGEIGQQLDQLVGLGGGHRRAHVTPLPSGERCWRRETPPRWAWSAWVWPAGEAQQARHRSSRGGYRGE